MSDPNADRNEQDSKAGGGSPRTALVVAVSENGVIGRDGDLPWRLPADLAHFKRLTMGHAMIMGRKTFDAIGRPLPGRVSIVLTRDRGWRAIHDEVIAAESLDNALDYARQTEGVASDPALVIGGGEVYRLALPRADRVYLTRVHARVEGDATFPELDPGEWRQTSAEEHPADEKNEHACTFEVWDRITD